VIYKFARYYYYKICGSKFLDFVDQGLGIEARSTKFKKQWQPHLKACKEFQLAAIEKYSDLRLGTHARLTILGAGRLLDVPCPQYFEFFSKIKLIDADPACILVWRKLKAQSKATIDWDLVDITSRLESWTNQLTNYLKISKKSAALEEKIKLANFLNSLKSQKVVKKWECLDSEVIISLNIFSQLGIYWKDRVLALLKDLAPYLLNDEAQLSSELELSLMETVSVLENEHLELLANSGAKMIVLLYDDEFYYYKSSQSQWQVEQALSLQSQPLLSGYHHVANKCWLWHLVPQGRENKEYGEIHRVQAISMHKDIKD
jgi:hypothetical protein